MTPSASERAKTPSGAGRISVRIQHHPGRAYLLPPLLEQLPGAEVVTDPDPDSAFPSPWRTYRECLARPAPAGTSHLLVLQDDVLLCRRFLEVAAELARPEPVALFLGGAPAVSAGRASRAPRGSLVALVPAEFVPVVALLWPVEVAESFLAWCGEHRLPGDPAPRSDDAVVGRWARRTGQVVYAATPSLVEHPDVEPSLIRKKVGAGRIKWRVAHDWIGPEADPFVYAWELLAREPRGQRR